MDAELQHYHDKGAILLYDTPYEASVHLIDNWQQNITQDTLKGSILLAFTRAAVADLNQQARDALQAKNLIGQENIDFQGLDKKLQISTGERLLFRQNDKVIGVRNGDLGTVRAVSKEQLQIELDSGERLNIPKTYQAMDYGYALTVHKSQGMTAEHAHVLIDSKYWDKHLSFVAMTRHKQSLKVYVDTVNHPKFDDLKRTLSRSVTKDNVIDWPLDFAIRAGFNPDKLVGRVVNHLAGVGHKIRDGFNYVVNYERYLLGDQLKLRAQDKTIVRSVAKKEADALDGQNKQSAYEVLKIKHPALAQYDELMKKRQYVTGYYRERTDKMVQKMAGGLVADKKMMREVGRITPKVAERIVEAFLGHLETALERER